jgi:MFS family permease
MFLIYSLPIAVLAAWSMSGRLQRLAEYRWRAPWLIWVALGIQVPLFSPLATGLSAVWAAVLHIISYGLLIAFMTLHRGVGFGPMACGTLLNLVAIVANGGLMPVTEDAWTTAFPGMIHEGANSVLGDGRPLWFLGDVMALPSWLPLTNVFSIGDVLLAIGLVYVVCRVATGAHERPRSRVRDLIEPLRQRDFRRMWLAAVVSECGDWLTVAAAVAWAYERSGTSLVAVVLLARMIPPVALSLWAGALADRLERRRLMVGSDLVRIVLVGATAVFLALGHTFAVVALIAAASAAGAFFAPAAGALLPRLVAPSLLVRSNALLGFTRETSMVVGLLAGAGIVALVGPWAAVALDTASFAVSAILLAGIAVGGRAVRSTDAGGPAITKGLAFAARTSDVGAAIVAFSGATVATGIVSAVLAEHAATALELGGAGYGQLLGALSAGLVIGQLAAGAVWRQGSFPRALALGLALMGLALALAAETTLLATALAALLIAGIADGATDVLFQSALQTRTPDELLGRVFGIARLGTRAGLVGGVAIAALADINSRQAILLASAILVGSTVSLALGAGLRTNAEVGVAPV